MKVVSISVIILTVLKFFVFILKLHQLIFMFSIFSLSCLTPLVSPKPGVSRTVKVACPILKTYLPDFLVLENAYPPAEFSWLTRCISLHFRMPFTPPTVVSKLARKSKNDVFPCPVPPTNRIL